MCMCHVHMMLLSKTAQLKTENLAQTEFGYSRTARTIQMCSLCTFVSISVLLSTSVSVSLCFFCVSHCNFVYLHHYCSVSLSVLLLFCVRLSTFMSINIPSLCLSLSLSFYVSLFLFSSLPLHLYLSLFLIT